MYIEDCLPDLKTGSSNKMTAYTIRFSAIAESDLEIFGDYYATISIDLNLLFFKDINRTILSLQRNPTAFHFYKKDKNIRRANLEIYPFGLYFYIAESEDKVVVLAIIHNRRSKSFINKRLIK